MNLEPYENQHLNTLRSLLPECTVLLKPNGTFPLEQTCNLSVYGNGVRNTIKGGTGSGEVNSRYSVSIEEGLENAGFTLTTKTWLDAYDRIRALAKEQFIKDIKALAKKLHTNAVMVGMGAVMPEPECAST